MLSYKSRKTKALQKCSAVFAIRFSLTGQYIAECIVKQINAVGPSNVIQVITDGASNCKSSWQIISDTFPHITCSPCAAHCLDLLLEDLSKIEWIKKQFKEGTEIVYFVTSHHKSLAIFRKHSD